MSLESFYALRDWCIQHSELQGSRTSGGPSIKEKIVMFLWTCNVGASNRQVQERFAYSRETISRCFHEVMEALLPLQNEVIKLPKADTPLGVRISEDTKYATYFTDYVRALDGTYINIRVPIEDRPRYRDRNGLLSQNVLIACNFDMVFCYILAG